MSKYILFLLFAFFTFNASAQFPPANDNCSGAILLASGTSCEEESFTTEFASESLPTGFLCSGNPDDDVWFRFVANSPCGQIEATGLDNFDATIQLFDGTCSNLVGDPCEDATGPGETEVLYLENLVVGQSYYFRVFDRGPIANQTDFIFDVCIVELSCAPVISFDHPCEALEDSLIFDTDGTVYYFNNTGTTTDDNEFLITPPNGVCDDYDYSGWCSTDAIQNSSWGAFVAPESGAVFVDVCNDGQTEILIQTAIYSFTDCNNFSTYTFIAGNEVSPDCSMGSQISDCNDLTPGETYLILVDGYQIAEGEVSISISDIGDLFAGTDSSVAICKNTPDYRLLDALPGANPNGFWIDVDGTGNVINGYFNAENTPAGSYQFIYVVPGYNCFLNDSASVTVTTQPIGNAGQNGIQIVCTESGDINLFNALQGTPDVGGSWLDPNGNTFDGMFDPNVDPAGQYTYVIGSPDEVNCPQDSAFAKVLTLIVDDVDAGEDGEVEVCTNTMPFAMIDYLEGSPDENGIWFDEFGTVVPGIFDPAIQPGGNYLYAVSAPGCGDAYAILTISLSVGPDAGISADSTICFNAATVNMFDMLGGSPQSEGQWSDGLGNMVSEFFNPETDTAGTYWYSVNGAGCPTDSASVSMMINAAANAGGDSAIAVCSAAGEFLMINLLGGEPQTGGQWTDPDGNPTSGLFNPTADLPGDYTYTLNGSCDTASAALTIGIEIDPNAGMGPSETEIIDLVDSDSINLWDQLSGDPSSEGTWFDLDNSGNLNDEIFTPDTTNVGMEYTFIYVVSNNCGSDTAFVMVHVVNSVGIDDISKISYSIYPNPARDRITIESHDLKGNYLLKIYDLSGRELFSKRISFHALKTEVLLELKAGSYLLTLSDNTNRLLTKSLIIQ